MLSLKPHLFVSVWLIGFAVPMVMLAQAGAQAPQTVRATGQPFAAIDESLLQQADAALASSSQRLAQNTKAEQGSDAARTGGAPVVVPQPAISREPTAAQERVEQLRPFVVPILLAEGIPEQLAAVILIESGGNPAALSPKGARGLWQLMPETARRYGLEVDVARDERLDIEKSTHAAARYLSDLHLQFGSWPLVLAAYNTGERNLQRAIDRSHSTEFAVLSSLGLLPLETRNYVPAVMAAMRERGLASLFAQREIAQKSATVFAATTQ